MFHNSQMAITIRKTLEALGKPHKPTPIRNDNSTATGFVYYNTHMKRSKHCDMSYYWLRDSMTQKEPKFIGKEK